VHISWKLSLHTRKHDHLTNGTTCHKRFFLTLKWCVAEVHKFSKSLWATSKFWRKLWTPLFLALYAWCMRPDKHCACMEKYFSNYAADITCHHKISSCPGFVQASFTESPALKCYFLKHWLHINFKTITLHWYILILIYFVYGYICN
jgi:hypothetical protein